VQTESRQKVTPAAIHFKGKEMPWYSEEKDRKLFKVILVIGILGLNIETAPVRG